MTSNMIPAKSKTELVASLQRMRSAVSRHRAEAEQAAIQGGAVLAGAGGAVAAGAIRHFRPNLIADTESPTDGIIGAALTLGSFFVTDQTARMAALAGGIGMSAPALARMTERVLAERDSD